MFIWNESNVKTKENELSTSYDKINLSNDDYKKVEAFNKIIQILKEENIRNSLSEINEKDEIENNSKSSKKLTKKIMNSKKVEEIQIISVNNTKVESMNEIFNFINNEKSEINIIFTNFIFINSNEFKKGTLSNFNDYLIELINKLNL